MSSRKKEAIDLSLPAEQLTWLQRMAVLNSLPDASKAARCCINCAALGGVKVTSNSSGKKEDGLVETSFDLAEEQIAWLRGRVGGDDKNMMSKIAADVVGTCMAADEQLVFGVVRCKLKVAECEGAQEAVDRIEKKYGTVQVEEDMWQRK